LSVNFNAYSGGFIFLSVTFTEGHAVLPRPLSYPVDIFSLNKYTKVVLQFQNDPVLAAYEPVLQLKF
jgi:hypothetical protein